MKFVHLSDLHIGKRWNEYSLIKDQRYILDQILNIIDGEKPDGVIVAGDVYDKSVPSAEAVELFDYFLVELARRKTPTFIISGNHDSAERIAFGGRIMDASGIYLSPVYDGSVKKVTLCDEFGNLNVYMLPFVKPVHVRRFYEDEEISSYEDALKVVIKNLNINLSERNLLITHQFIAGAERSDSEETSVGGADNISADVFKDFDYVALGHIHAPQNIGSQKIRYCGTPLKYSFSEKDHKKSVTIAELGAKGDLKIREIGLKPLHEVVELRGKYNDISSRKFYENTTYNEDYVRVVLTDEDDQTNALGKLRAIYHNLMELKYDNERTRRQVNLDGAAAVEQKTPIELCEEFFISQNGSAMCEEQRGLLSSLIEEIWEKNV